MKKYIYVLVTVVFFSGLFTYSNRPLKEVNVQGSHHIFDTVEQLSDFADLIIVGSMEKDFSKYQPTITYSEHGRLSDYYTITDIKIDKIIKGDYSAKIVPAIQPAAVIEDRGSFSLTHRKVLVDEGYTLMEKNRKYIVFLKKTDLEGVYSLISLQGKFNIDNLDLKEKELENKYSQFKNFKNEVLTKFNNKIK